MASMKLKADNTWSKAVKILANLCCERCGKPEPLNSHHFISRRFKATRYDPLNGFCLCVSCHFFAHQRSAEFSRWAIAKRGELWYQQLNTKSKRIKTDVSFDLLICEKICKPS